MLYLQALLQQKIDPKIKVEDMDETMSNAGVIVNNQFKMSLLTWKRTSTTINFVHPLCKSTEVQLLTNKSD